MTNFRTTEQIKSTVWKHDHSETEVNHNPEYWTKDSPLTIDEVKTWEEIVFVPGCYGIYVSWDPYEEFYAITLNQFLDHSFGVKIFSGEDAAREVKIFAKKLGCDLDTNSIWIENQSA